MADVNLSVAVSSTGVAAAIAKVESLGAAGRVSAASLNQLAAASQQAMRNMTNASLAAGTGSNRFLGFDAAITKTGAGAMSLSQQLKTLEKAYMDVARAAPAATAAQRLTMLGGKGGLAAGMNQVATMGALQGALNPSWQRDQMEVQRQQMALDDARASRAGAQAQLAAARWNTELAGMSATARAQAILTRATAEYANALTAVDRSRRGADGRFLPHTTAVIQGQTQAVLQLAAAENQLTAAKQGVHRERQMNDGNAFQSSYSYFIIAGLATAAAVSIRDMGAAALTASAQIERSFTDVQRTTEGTGRQLESLREHLSGLATATPVSFIDLAEIATLGNQLGVAAEDIEGFTTVMAQYTAVSGQSADNAATAFGRISNLTGLAASEYSNLASAITYVARTSVATESTIQNTAKEITALAAGAGFSADSIVGLAGALSSLAIPPERARGALSLYFGALNSAVAEGGPKMEAFSTVTNKTAKELEAMVRENRGQEVFTAFIQGLSELDTVAKSSALDELGLSTIRVDQTMRALSQNVPLLTSSFAGANKAFRENVEIGNQYALIQDDLTSQWTMFQNAVQLAAGAMGDGFAPAAKNLLATLNTMLVSLTAFADHPIGKAFVTFIGLAAGLTAAIAAIVGIAALAKASLVVLGFAVSGFGWTSATAGLRGWIAALFASDQATRVAARSATGFGVALAEQKSMMSGAAIGARALAVAMNVLKVALPILAITAAIAIFTEMADALDKAINPSKRLTDDLSGLRDALIADNPNVLNRALEALAGSTQKTTAEVSPFNAAILAAIGIQRRAENAFNDTNDAIDGQSFRLGEASRAWIEEQLLSQEDIADILDGYDFSEQLADFWDGMWGGSGGADSGQGVKRDEFEKMVLGGLDLNTISQIAVTQGKDAALKAYAGWQDGFEKANPGDTSAERFRRHVLDNVLNSVVDAYGKAAVQAALKAGGAIDAAGLVTETAAERFKRLSNEMDGTAEAGDHVVATFFGARSSLSALQGAVQGAMKGFVDFKSVLKTVQDVAKETADKKKDDSLLTSMVNAEAFGAELGKATASAETFYSGITQLAAGGNTSFALQLSELGPEAQAILSSALELGPEGQAKLEAAARFAAFLASSEFSKALEANSQNFDEAYATIFSKTGSLDKVREYIAAQVAGTGAEWERQWAVLHPDVPINVTPELMNPTDADLAAWEALASGKITVKAAVEIERDANGRPRMTGANVFTDTATGNSLTLPASLDGAALNASLDIWQRNQWMSPEQLAAELNKQNLSADLDAWRNAHGPVTIGIKFNIPNLPDFGVDKNGRPHNRAMATGGIIDERNVPHFASGGSWGQFAGPGTGTSDSMWSKVSTNEYINTADATNYWGPDFFDSLNRKMLPTSFLNMLGAAAGSGNSGPTHVANVNVALNNPLTRDPLKQLRENSEMLVSGIWGD